jgi:hypothetical protein
MKEQARAAEGEKKKGKLCMPTAASYGKRNL